MKDRFEYVDWEEVRPVKIELNTINQRMASFIRNNCPELRFDPELVGSAERGLVTRIIDGSKGFDLDYNLIINHPGFNESWDAKVVKECFMDAVNYAVEGTDYSHAKDSTRAITIKKVDSENSRINYSCDYAIIYYEEDGYSYLHNNKKGGVYSFNHRDLKYPIAEMEKIIWDYAEYPEDWIREEYLKVKNSDRDNKPSFTLYIETLYNILNTINQIEGAESAIRTITFL